jgi:hypothetical protein
MLSISFDIKGALYKEFFLELILNTTVTYHGDCVQICDDFAPNFGDKNWLLHHDKAPSYISFLTKELLPNTTYLSSQPILPFPVSPIKDKTERPPF